MSPMRCGGTPISLASRYFVGPNGFRNSSSRISTAKEAFVERRQRFYSSTEPRRSA
jgi:hypothetical protein